MAPPRRVPEDADAMSSTLMISLAGAFSWGLGTIVLLAFIVAIATVVRRHRPDAAPLLLGAMLFELLITLTSYATTIVLPRLTSVSSGGGYPSYIEAQAASTVVFSVAHAASRALLLWG